MDYSLKAVCLKTGLSPHVIRVWERRYGAVQPQRDEMDRRTYTEAELQRLMLLGRATRAGHPIRKIARLPQGELERLAGTAEPVGAPEEWVEQCLDAVRQFDEPRLEALVAAASAGLPLLEYLDGRLVPLLQETGDRWARGDLRVAHEHMVSAVVRSFLGEHPAAPMGGGAPRMVVATPAGQLHELGALMACVVARTLGWEALFLGPSLPAEEIAGAARSFGATVVLLGVTWPRQDAGLVRELNRLLRMLPEGCILGLGGAAAPSCAAALGGRARSLAGLRELGDLVAPGRQARRPGSL